MNGVRRTLSSLVLVLALLIISQGARGPSLLAHANSHSSSNASSAQQAWKGWGLMPGTISDTAVTPLYLNCGGQMLFSVHHQQIFYQMAVFTNDPVSFPGSVGSGTGSNGESPPVPVPGNFATDVEVTAVEYQNNSSQSCDGPVYLFAKSVNQPPNNGGSFSYTVFDGSNWTPWQPLPPPGGTSVGASAAVFAGKLFLISTGNDHRVWYRTFDGSTWTTFARIGADTGVCQTAAAPRIEVYNELLYIFESNQVDNSICFMTLTAQLQASGWSEVGGGGHTDTALGSAVSKGVLYLFGRGINDKGSYANSFSSGTWTGWQAVPGAGQTNVALTAANAPSLRIQLFHTNLDGSVSFNVLLS